MITQFRPHHNITALFSPKTWNANKTSIGTSIHYMGKLNWDKLSKWNIIAKGLFYAKQEKALSERDPWQSSLQNDVLEDVKCCRDSSTSKQLQPYSWLPLSFITLCRKDMTPAMDSSLNYTGNSAGDTNSMTPALFYIFQFPSGVQS